MGSVRNIIWFAVVYDSAKAHYESRKQSVKTDSHALAMGNAKASKRKGDHTVAMPHEKGYNG